MSLTATTTLQRQTGSGTLPPVAAEDLAVWRATLAQLRTITRRSVVDAWFDKVVVLAPLPTRSVPVPLMAPP